MRTVLIFDYDGVIVDSLEMFMDFFITSCKDHGWNQISTTHDFLSLFKGNMYENMMRLGMTKQDILDVVLQVKEELLNHMNKLSMFPQMKQTLQELSKQYTLCIITSNETKVVEQFLEKYDITFFSTIYGSDVHHSKIKKIEHIKQTIPADKYIYIGDTLGDILEGKKAHVHTLGVTWGWHSKEQIKKGNPDCIVESISDLPTTLSSLC